MKFTKNEIEKAKEIAERNLFESAEIGDEGMAYFMFNEVRIVNPWVDETGRFDLTDAEAVKTYGLENVMNFIIDVLKEEN